MFSDLPDFMISHEQRVTTMNMKLSVNKNYENFIYRFSIVTLAIQINVLAGFFFQGELDNLSQIN